MVADARARERPATRSSQIRYDAGQFVPVHAFRPIAGSGASGRARRRTRSLREAGVTALLTSEAAEETPYASRYGIVEYLTDAGFVLQYVRPDDFRETRPAVEIRKIRDANHSREKKPYEITGEGISIYQQANLF